MSCDVAESGQRAFPELVREADAGAEHDHEATGDQGLYDVAKMVVDVPHRRGLLELTFLAQDRAIELAQRRARLDAKLVDEHAPCVVVGLKGISLTAGPVERQHQLATQPLAQ